MPILYKDATLSPFMSDSQSLSVGLNPLGMRTASEQLFTTLLPGMNVVTLRVRYYSFYCWLLKQFYAVRDKADLNDFRRHIRVSELLMALIHAQCHQGLGVPGITYASGMVETEIETLDILSGAMPEGKSSGGYWKGVLGALGTYYVASLQEMGLVAPLLENPHLYNVTKGDKSDFINGEQLAEAFEDSIGKECTSLFMTCVQKGIVSRSELSKLGEVFLSQRMKDCYERELLKNMLLQFDRPSSGIDSRMRKNTLYLLLKYLDVNEMSNFSELEFSRFVYHEYKKENVISAAAVGWYAYYLNDSRQFEALKIFAELLDRLRNSNKPGQWENIHEFTTMLAEEVSEQLGIASESLEEVLLNWGKVEHPHDKMSMAFYQILDDYVNNQTYQKHKGLLHQYFHAVHNDALDSFDLIERNFEEPFKNFIKLFLTDNIIYAHYTEAMRKYSQNGVPTQKLTIENGFVKGLDSYEATHSSPRVNTLFNFITDLGLVRNYKLTKEGTELINRLEHD